MSIREVGGFCLPPPVGVGALQPASNSSTASGSEPGIASRGREAATATEALQCQTSDKPRSPIERVCEGYTVPYRRLWGRFKGTVAISTDRVAIGGADFAGVGCRSENGP